MVGPSFVITCCIGFISAFGIFIMNSLDILSLFLFERKSLQRLNFECSSIIGRLPP